MAGSSFIPAEHESLIHVEGLLTPEDQLRVTDFLGQLGVRATYIENNPEPEITENYQAPTAPATQIESIRQHGYLFSDIQSADDILVREHFEDLGSHSPNVDGRSYVRAFHYMIDHQGIGRMSTFDSSLRGQTKFRQIRDPKPYDGMVIVPRVTAGLDSYKANHLTEKETAIMAQYGMTAGSTLQALAWTEQLNPSKANKTQSALLTIAQKLKEQLS